MSDSSRVNSSSQNRCTPNDSSSQFNNTMGYTIQGVTKLYVKLPVERVGVVIGKGGETLRKLMEFTKTLITVNEVDGIVVIEPASPRTRPIDLMKAQDVIKAIGYGFSPDRAFRLLDEDTMLIVIDLREHVKASPNHLARVKGRIIGEEGRVRKNLEDATGTYISVYEDYVAIIGEYENASITRDAVMMIVEGRQHATVYKYVDRAMRQIKKAKMISLWRT
ncbi:MAG: KH domain-containing protein [Ignisphaera sp.]|nr:KH domain-containing protein [Ignisphaera sp.]MCX8168345.1 KH domain-containing protein [Ignisphaera sp.]MDW8085322.1 KH domain-containing protein [Ignisphaera sp.]